MAAYNFFAYGSLISHESLKKTIKDKEFTPVFVNGYKRVFNLIAKKSKYPDVLNLKKFKGAKCNGVLFKIDEKELVKIKEREDDYNLEQVWVYDFVTKNKLCKCFTVIDYFVALDKIGKKPNKKYFMLCREAAYHIGKEFGNYWDKTTYTSKGEKISEWLKQNKDFDSIS